MAMVWRSVSGGPWAQGADGSGTACHVCCDPAALPPSLSPFWKEEPGGFRQAPAQADRTFLSQECPFLWGSVMVAAGGWALRFLPPCPCSGSGAWGLCCGGCGRVAVLPLLAPGPGGRCSSQAQILTPKLRAPPPSLVKMDRCSLLTAVLGPEVWLGVCVGRAGSLGDPQAGHLSPWW